MKQEDYEELFYTIGKIVDKKVRVARLEAIVISSSIFILSLVLLKNFIL